MSIRHIWKCKQKYVSLMELYVDRVQRSKCGSVRCAQFLDPDFLSREGEWNEGTSILSFLLLLNNLKANIWMDSLLFSEVFSTFPN